MLPYFAHSACLIAVARLFAQTPVPGGLSLVDKWGIAGLCILIVFVLYKRDEKRETAREEERKAMESERLEVQKAMLALQEGHNEKLAELLERTITSHSDVAAAMRELKCKGHTPTTVHKAGV